RTAARSRAGPGRRRWRPRASRPPRRCRTRSPAWPFGPSYRGGVEPPIAILPPTGGCPSGQRERSVKSPAKPTEVRILLLPPAVSRLDSWASSSPAATVPPPASSIARTVCSCIVGIVGHQVLVRVHRERDPRNDRGLRGDLRMYGYAESVTALTGARSAAWV